MNEPANGISVVVHVLDDREGMRVLLEAVAGQSRLPDECIVVEGGSTDGTATLLRSWSAPFPLRVIRHPGRSIAAARNVGVTAAAHDWIVCTDAGCRPDRDWLHVIEAARVSADFVAGVVEIEPRTEFERVLALTHYPVRDELDDPPTWIRVSHRLFGRGYVPDRSGAGNMAFSKAVWREMGGFPEVVYAGDDRAMTSAVRRAGFRLIRAPEAIVSWRPPGTLTGNARMFFTYSRGDVRFPGRARHAARLAAWLIGTRALAGGWRCRLLLSAGGLAYIALPLHRARDAGLPLKSWWRIPMVVALKDLSQIAGAATGLLDAVRGVPQPPPTRRSRASH